MEEKANTGQVIIVLTEHLTFGTLLIPYMAEKSDDGTYQLIEQAFHASPEAISRMNEAEQQAIDIASHYTEKYLMGIYSRENSIPFSAQIIRRSGAGKEQYPPIHREKNAGDADIDTPS